METFLKSGKKSFTYKHGIDGHLAKMQEILNHLTSLRKHGQLPMFYMQHHLHQNTDFDASPWCLYEQHDGKHMYANHVGSNLHVYIPINGSKTLKLTVD